MSLFFLAGSVRGRKGEEEQRRRREEKRERERERERDVCVHICMIEDTSWPTGWRRFELWFVSSLPDVSLGREQDRVDMQPANVHFEEMSDGEKDTHTHTHTHTQDLG